MIEKRKQQAVALLEQFKQGIVEEQCKASVNKNKKKKIDYIKRGHYLMMFKSY